MEIDNAPLVMRFSTAAKIVGLSYRHFNRLVTKELMIPYFKLQSHRGQSLNMITRTSLKKFIMLRAHRKNNDNDK